MIRINQCKLKVNHTEEQLRKKAAALLHIPEQQIQTLEIIRQSVDARKKPEIFYSYTVDVQVSQEEKLLRKLKNNGQIGKAEKNSYCFPAAGTEKLKYRPVIIGMGPAGLFCGYYLALHGYQPILLERGKCVEDRQQDVEAFWQTGVLNTASNVQFGEGGAGAFSDGKLNTLVKDKYGRNKEVLDTFVKFGAKKSICYEAKPHIGTDVLCGIVKRMRERILELGGQVCFESQVTEIEISDGKVAGVVINGTRKLACEQLVLAIGHSARDTFSMLYEKKVPMAAKSFAVGFRVEHPQTMINKSQYGVEDPEALGLGAASYKLAAKTSRERGVYSFCMCPGGYVVNASSEEGRTAVNGMSYSGRDGRNANSAIIVSVTPQDFASDHPLAGVEFQRQLESRAYQLGKGKIPVQRYEAFCRAVKKEGKPEDMEQDTMPDSEITPQCKGGFTWTDVSSILPQECNDAFIEGMEEFGKQIQGYNRPDAVLSGVESRTSSPVRIHRDETLQSQIRGLYPCGEGAGYAGGITSAAMDGLHIAEAIASKYAPWTDREE